MLHLPAGNLLDSSHSKKVVLMLFHNDLRVNDNATLARAAALAQNNDGRLLLVYALDFINASQQHWDKAYYYDEMGFARQQFLADSLTDLDKSLQRLGNQLLVLPKESMKALCQLIESAQVSDVCVSHSADYAQNQAYIELQQQYPKINWHYQQTATLFPSLPMSELPKSFTPFRKQVESHHHLLDADDNLIITETPKSLPPLPDVLTDNSEYGYTPQVFYIQAHATQAQPEPRYQGGERSANAHLNDYFNAEAPCTYKTTRNALDEWTHSTKFSAWLANGTLSVKVLLNRLRQYERDVLANESTYWIWFELLWREYFYWYAVTHQQQLFLYQGIRSQKPMTHSDKKHDKNRLAQWQTGTTLYPIVNACMRQLNATGYMSNRGRQIVASCFIHELGLDWRYGAHYFEQQLIDYDVASNWGNWQYLAGVGADPRGCRQFNLAKQTEQHDPEGHFIKKWQNHS